MNADPSVSTAVASQLEEGTLVSGTFRNVIWHRHDYRACPVPQQRVAWQPPACLPAMGVPLRYWICGAGGRACRLSGARFRPGDSARYTERGWPHRDFASLPRVY